MQAGAVVRSRGSQPLEAPDHLFHHVEKSLDNGIKPNMLAEVLYSKSPDLYWIAHITMVCGHLLRMRYIGSVVDTWYDMNKTTIYHLGWCAETRETLEPPTEIAERYGDTLGSLLKEAIGTQPSIPKEALIAHGSMPIDKILPGMKVEVQHEKHPYKFWIATILKNVGGRLLLRYDAPEDVENDFWIFYSNPRVTYVGYSKNKNGKYELAPPKHEKYSKFTLSDWSKCKNALIKLNEDSGFPISLYSNANKPERHSFAVGMKLEALNPTTMSEICPATITAVYDEYYFLVSLDNELDDNNSRQWLCDNSHPYIFPISWSQSININICSQLLKKYHSSFLWKKYLDITKSSSAPYEYFPKRPSALKFGFKVGMKLEAVDPLNRRNISVATVKTIAKHLLQVSIEYTGNLHWFSYDSQDLYPSGWCSSNNVTLCTPEAIKAQSENIEHIKMLQSYNVPAEIKEKWCDRVYFNYKCYSGPLISKNKLSQLPRHVGPGPLSLVLKEVLNMIISVAYKPGSLLKEWEYDGTPRPNVKLELLKAKLKTNTHYGSVETIIHCEELTKYCKTMCEKLQACPYLFGTTEITEQCPEQCSVVNKSKFRKKTRKKGLHFMTIRARERRAALESSENLSKDDTDEKEDSLEKDDQDNAESCNESDQSRSLSPHASESGTRPNSPDSLSGNSHIRKRTTKPKIPPLEMKTRGAKLPNFAKQIKTAHWDRKEIYRQDCKRYLDSESDNNSCNSTDSKNELSKISDVSDAEEPELKKLRVTPLHDMLPTNGRRRRDNSDSSNSYQSFDNAHSNPGAWSVHDVYSYLMKFKDFHQIAERLRDEEIDGMAFIMLNLPTMRENLKMKDDPALRLCKIVAALKWAYYQYHYSHL